MHMDKMQMNEKMHSDKMHKDGHAPSKVTIQSAEILQPDGEPKHQSDQRNSLLEDIRSLKPNSRSADDDG